eukprot:11751058-Alexandrium_andersonii.AAC.1
MSASWRACSQGTVAQRATGDRPAGSRGAPTKKNNTVEPDAARRGEGQVLIRRSAHNAVITFGQRD